MSCGSASGAATANRAAAFDELFDYPTPPSLVAAASASSRFDPRVRSLKSWRRTRDQGSDPGNISDQSRLRPLWTPVCS
jgi:hypothetical protein